jgi:hypothetical protein
MRWKMPAGVMLAVALLIPAAPAMAQSGTPKTAAATCQTITYVDIRTLIPADLDAATDTRVRIAATQILNAATTEKLTYLPGQVQQALDSTSVDLRAFLRTRVQPVWMTDLRIAANQALAKGGPNVQTAAQTALDTDTADGFMAFFNHELYRARARDCAL